MKLNQTQQILLATTLLFSALLFALFILFPKDTISLLEQDQEGEKNKYMNIIERAQQEFDKTRDPTTKTVPTDRLLQAKKQIETMAATNNIAVNNVNWTERGPNNVGGRTRAIFFDRSDNTNNIVFAAGVSGGLWRTTNFQAANPTWTPINDFFQNIAVTAIAQHPTTLGTMYFGTGEGYDGNIRGLGIWKSTNGGTTWTQIAATSNFNFIQDLSFDSQGNIYATTRANGLQKSTDGTTWTKVLGTVGADLEFAIDNDMYVTMGLQGTGTNGGIFKSDFQTHGNTTGDLNKWADITPTNANTNPAIANGTLFERIEISVAPSNANRLYALCEGNGMDDVSHIFRSDNGGTTWTTLNVPTICDQGSNSIFTRQQAWYDLISVVNLTNPDQVYIGGIDALRSMDGGVTWTQITDWANNFSCGGNQPQNVHADHHQFIFEPGTATKLVMGTDGGLYHTININQALPTFTNKNQGYRVTQFYSCAVHPTTGSNYFLGGTQDNGTPQFNAAGLANTTDVGGGDGGFCHIDQDNSMIQIISNTNNQLQISTNGGNSFDFVDFNGGAFISPTDYDNTANILYANHSFGRFMRWNNPAAGAGAPSADTLAVTGVPNIGNITHVSVSPNTANRVYFGDDFGNVFRVDNANTGTTTIAGTRIFDPNANTGFTNISVSGIAVEKGNENHLLVTFSNYGVPSVFESTNGGTSWTNVENNLPDMPVRWVLFSPLDGDQAFLATELGVWSTNDLNGGNTDWTVTNMGLANVRVDMLQHRASDNLIAAATHGRGLFTTTNYGSNCVATLALNNNPIAAGTYQTSNTITSAGRVAANTNVTMDAKTSITLQTNFHAEKNSTFLAKIGGCTSTLVSKEDQFAELNKILPVEPAVQEVVETAVEFSLYPSPASGEVTVDLTLAQPTEAVITLHSSTGSIVKVIQSNTYLDSGAQQLSFYAGNFQSGMYYVVISTPQMRKSQKLMIVGN